MLILISFLTLFIFISKINRSFDSKINTNTKHER